MQAHEATAAYDCKFPGCTNEARSRVGRYSYCAEHQGKGKRAVTYAKGVGSVEQRIKSLATLAREVDRAKAKAKRLAENALTARDDAAAKEREFQQLAREVIGDNGTGEA